MFTLSISHMQPFIMRTIKKNSFKVDRLNDLIEVKAMPISACGSNKRGNIKIGFEIKKEGGRKGSNQRGFYGNS